MKGTRQGTCTVGLVAAAVASLVLMTSACDLLGGEPELIVGPGHFATIQATIDASSDGDTIVVLPGTYVGSVSFNGKNLTLRSATREELDDLSWDYPGDPASFNIVSETVIDGGGAESVIVLDSGVERDAVIRGLTITGGGQGIYVGKGSVVTIADSIIENNTNGGIVLVASSSNADQSETPSRAVITNNTIKNNTRAVGGGVHLGHNSEATIENNVFTNNSATKTTAPYGGAAIGLYTFGSHDTVNVIKNNTFSANTASRVGGAIYLMGNNAVTTITGNEITGNGATPESQASGGGIYISSCQSAIIYDNNFADNSTVWRGGAMVILAGKTYGSGNTLMTDANYSGFNTFVGNTADTTVYDDIYVDS